MRAASAAALAALAYAGSARAQDDWTLGPLDERGTVTYFIAKGEGGSSFRDTDPELARWALAAWQTAAEGKLEFVPAPEDEALVRVYWVPANGGGQYGEMRPLAVDGRRGAAVFIRPDTDALGPEISELANKDALFRDSVVYLTCLHELGHALGLEHTTNFDDIMYFFGFGGSVARFFGRYRFRLETRDDITRFSGLSPADVLRLRARLRK